jgi:hypothetical protein
MGFEWVDPPEAAFDVLYTAYSTRLYTIAVAVCARRAPEIESWMKQNALWTDRTGNARQTLNTRVVSLFAEILVILDHGMDYGFWLEKANAGRWAIVAPAVDYWAPILMDDLRQALS